jgi:ubiquinone/menaquinone biosynthesis C-methylase UbiE
MEVVVALAPNLEVPAFNKHYEGEYDTRMTQWRRICAKDKARNIAALVAGYPVQTILDVGCGTGAVLDELSKANVGLRHVGVDVADPELHSETALELMHYDGEALPFNDNSFDLVYASHVLEHVLEPRKFLAELQRVGNLVYIEVPCELNLRTSYYSLQATLNIGHINAFTPHSFALMLQTTGLEVLDLKIFDHSIEVHQFNSSITTARLKAAVRQGLLGVNASLASKIFTYHCGALCRKKSLQTI